MPDGDQNAKLVAYKVCLRLGAGRFASWLPILAVEALNSGGMPWSTHLSLGSGAMDDGLERLQLRWPSQDSTGQDSMGIWPHERGVGGASVSAHIEPLRRAYTWNARMQ